MKSQDLSHFTPPASASGSLTKKVMVFGTFDLLHDGHVNMFEQAKRHGDFLIAVVARDSTVEVVKQHKTLFDENQRLNAVKSIKLVDLAVLGSLGDKYAVIEEHKPDVICLGYDQDSFTKLLTEELNKRNLFSKIIRLEPYKEDVFKSSKLKLKV